MCWAQVMHLKKMPGVLNIRNSCAEDFRLKMFGKCEVQTGVSWRDIQYTNTPFIY